MGNTALMCRECYRQVETVREPAPLHDRGPTTQQGQRREPMAPTATGTGPAWRTALIGALALALALGLLGTVWLLARPLALLLAAVIIATALSPAVEWLERRLPRVFAILLVYLVVVLAIGGIGWVVVPPMARQAQGLITGGPELIESGRSWVDRWDPLGEERLVNAIQSTMDRFSSVLLAVPFKVLSTATEILLVLIMSIYWLLVSPALYRFVLSLFPGERRDWAGSILQEMGRSMGGYVRGAVLDGIIVAAIVYTALLIIGVDFPLVLALVTGVAELVPVVGPIVAAVPAFVIAWLDSPVKALIVLVFYVVLHQFEGNILLPNIMRRQADIPPLLTLFALFTGGSVGGILGALIAIPLAGALRVLVLRVIAPAVRRWTGADGTQPARPPV